MNQIIIASHSKLASGMKETIEFFGGSHIEVLEQSAEETGFETKLKQLLEKYKEENCIVFTDLLGGSVNQLFFKNLANYQFHLVTGMNLAMILECAFASNCLTKNEIKEIVDTSKMQCLYMNDLLNAENNEDED